MMSTRVLAEKLKRERKKCKKLKSTNEYTSSGRKTKKRKQKTKCHYTTRKQIPKGIPKTRQKSFTIREGKIKNSLCDRGSQENPNHPTML
jgi:hypothetical protein